VVDCGNRKAKKGGKKGGQACDSYVMPETGRRMRRSTGQKQQAQNQKVQGGKKVPQWLVFRRRGQVRTFPGGV